LRPAGIGREALCNKRLPIRHDVLPEVRERCMQAVYGAQSAMPGPSVPRVFRCAMTCLKCKQSASISGFSPMPARKRRQDKCRLQATARKALQLGDVQPPTSVI
ncbi:hypothetical protein, partial [Ralstonia pseudosolanacearum]|uniref:hypothetical protein n=1 Tax=Ralstonia pseudosolanacearum TaxID=1310165 RepID=UPI0032218E7A